MPRLSQPWVPRPLPPPAARCKGSRVSRFPLWLVNLTAFRTEQSSGSVAAEHTCLQRAHGERSGVGSQRTWPWVWLQGSGQALGRDEHTFSGGLLAGGDPVQRSLRPGGNLPSMCPSHCPERPLPQLASAPRVGCGRQSCGRAGSACISPRGCVCGVPWAWGGVGDAPRRFPKNHPRPVAPMADAPDPTAPSYRLKSGTD